MARTAQAYCLQTKAPGLQRMWQSMRILRRFTVADLVITAEAGESMAGKYVRLLQRTGYLRLAAPLASGQPGSRNVWLLVRGADGPVAPIRRKDGSGVYDPNTKVAWGLDGNPIANAKDVDAVARGLLAKLQDQQRDDAAASDFLKGSRT